MAKPTNATPAHSAPIPARRVLFIFRRQRALRLHHLEQKEGPDEMLYGLNLLNPERFATAFIEGDDRRWTPARVLAYPLERWIARVVKLGFALHIALDHLAALRQADVIISTNDSCGLPVALLKWLRLIQAPILYISQGLSDRMAALVQRPFYYRIFYPFYRALLRTADRIIVLGEGAAGHLEEVFALPPHSVHTVPFGIDAHFWHPAAQENPEDYILSIGSDPARDYATLLQAVAREPQSLRIVTRLALPNATTLPHVTVGTDYSDVELRTLYQQAKFVVTPLHDVTQPTGQSATLQAMACGKAVILSRIQGLWDAKHLHHLETCYLVTPGDVDELQQAIAFLSSHPGEAARIGQNARRLVEEHYTSQHFAHALEQHIDAMLGQYSFGN